MTEQDNYNLRAAMIHVIGDLIQSIGVLIAALVIFFMGEKDSEGKVIWTPCELADPLCTYLFSVLVLCTTIPIARDCIKVLMEGTP
jgi:zinc transporter 2